MMMIFSRYSSQSVKPPIVKLEKESGTNNSNHSSIHHEEPLKIGKYIDQVGHQKPDSINSDTKKKKRSGREKKRGSVSQKNRRE